MIDDRYSGVALILGSAGIIITLALHPSDRGLFQPDTFQSAARTLMAVHSIALFSFPILFVGAYGLSRRLSPLPNTFPFALSGLVFYSFALASMMIGVAFDGLVSPGLAKQIISTTGSIGQGWRIAFNYNSLVDQAFVRVFVMGSSIAVLLWSASILRTKLSRGSGIFGFILGVGTIAAQLTGAMDRAPHTFLMVLVAQALWFTILGVILSRTPQIRREQPPNESAESLTTAPTGGS
jgi:hypothetical protein